MIPALIFAALSVLCFWRAARNIDGPFYDRRTSDLWALAGLACGVVAVLAVAAGYMWGGM